MAYVSVPAHRSMALDRVRNDAYAAALARVITPDSVVLDLGAGTGIHGLMAARLGARRVYLVEPEDILSLAAEAVRANGLETVVQCIQARIEDVVLDEPVDIIVSAMTGNVLVGEDLVPLVLRARDTLLRPGGTLIPQQAAIQIAPVSAAALFQREVADWTSTQHGVSLAPVRRYAANSLHYRWKHDAVTCLAAPAPAHHVDFARDRYDGVHASVTFRVARAGVCHGLAAWFDMQLGDCWVSTGPNAPAMHWSPAFLPLDPPVALDEGSELSVRVDRAPYGEWTWRVSGPAGSQQHSTLLGAPATAATLKKAAIDYQPRLNRDGEATAFVLSRCNGSTTVTEIAAELQRCRSRPFVSDADALRLVQSIIRRLA